MEASLRAPEQDRKAKYMSVKSYVLERIRAGKWKAEDRIPSEHKLVEKLKVSRMTANRAIRELTNEGYLRRVPGSGTYVSPEARLAQPLEIRDIREEVRARGNRHSLRVVHLEAEERSPNDILAHEGKVFRSVILHYENGRPVQMEDRMVNPAAAAGYLTANLHKDTPEEFLSQVSPADEVEHSIEAIMPDAAMAADLRMGHREPVLLVTRRHWTQGRLVSIARLFHPGGRYRLGGLSGEQG